VADGRSTDATTSLATAPGARLVPSDRGRGVQLAAGAAAARTELLLFPDADTLLPAPAAAVLAAVLAVPSVQIGTLRLRFDAAGPFLRAGAWLTRFGDQAIVVRRDFYERLGGFPPWLLFEDIDFLRRARRVMRVWSFPAHVTTSARRFRQRGPLRQQWLNTRLLLRFLAGAPLEKLARLYRA